MEDIGSLAKVYTDLTNLLMDAAQWSAIPAFAMVADMIKNPAQILNGVYPGATFELDGGDPTKFAEQISTANVDANAVKVWEQLKSELSEAMWQNEIGLGQFAPNSRTSATEISSTQQSTSAMIRAVAHTIETRFINPVLDLTWKTQLQYARPDDSRMSGVIGEDVYATLLGRRRELIKRPITFQAQGISALIQKQQMFSALMQLLQIIASNQMLSAAFIQRVDMNRLISLLFTLSNVDIRNLQATDRDRMIQSITNPLMGAAGQQQGNPNAGSGFANNEINAVTQMLGIGKGAPQ
jgi:hypothetical protein